MVNCLFCDKTIEQGRGITYIQNNAKILHFCSSKCKKNHMKLGRKSRNIKWSGLYEKGK